jgi:hypothetical protein
MRCLLYIRDANVLAHGHAHPFRLGGFDRGLVVDGSSGAPFVFSAPRLTIDPHAAPHRPTAMRGLRARRRRARAVRGCTVRARMLQPSMDIDDACTDGLTDEQRDDSLYHHLDAEGRPAHPPRGHVARAGHRQDHRRGAGVVERRQQINRST